VTEQEPDNIAIEITDLWKRYGLPLPRFITTLARRLTKSSERTDTLPWALKGLDLTVYKGENLGIIGGNGAGKSTLLKILAGVSPATRGDVKVNGRVFPMIELQAGVNPDLTGRENIELLGAVMGYSPNEMAARYGAIADFSELGGWLERPVRMYSSGMQARLAFSVAINTDADILLVDEVLGVGDYRFQKKCVERLEQLKLSSQTTLVFVSHNPYQVQRLCDRVLLLNGGEQLELVEASKALDLYFGRLGAKETTSAGSGISLPSVEHRDGSGCLRIDSIDLLDGVGSAIETLTTGEPATIRMHYSLTGAVRNPNFGVRIFDSQNTCVLSFAYTRHLDGSTLERGGYVDCRLAEMPLLAGSYMVQVKVAGDELFDFIQSAPGLEVHAPTQVVIDTADLGLFYERVEWLLVQSEDVAQDGSVV